MVKRNFQPYQIITLYDRRKNKSFKGSLFFDTSTDSFLSVSITSLPLKIFRSKTFLQRLAFVCLVLSVVGFGTLLFPLAVSALGYFPSYKESADESITKLLKESNKSVDYSAYEVGKGVRDEPIDNTFQIVVPKIGLESNIVMNVDTASEEDYRDKLQYGIAHAKGTYLPGEQGLVYLFAHSTDSVANILRYNAKFFGVNKLETGDSIKINFRGKEYQYIVTGKTIVSPEDVKTIRNTKSDLVLQTCWPLGTDWQRLIIFADLIPN